MPGRGARQARGNDPGARVTSKACAGLGRQVQARCALSGGLSIAYTHRDTFGAAGVHSPSPRTLDEAASFFGDEGDSVTASRLRLDVGEADQRATRVIAPREPVFSRDIRHSSIVTRGHHDGACWSAHNAAYPRFSAAAFLAADRSP